MQLSPATQPEACAQARQGHQRLRELRAEPQRQSQETHHGYPVPPGSFSIRTTLCWRITGRPGKTYTPGQVSFCRKPYKVLIYLHETHLTSWMSLCHRRLRFMHLEQTKKKKKELPLSSPEGNNDIQAVYFQELRARGNGAIWDKDYKANTIARRQLRT